MSRWFNKRTIFIPSGTFPRGFFFSLSSYYLCNHKKIGELCAPADRIRRKKMEQKRINAIRDKAVASSSRCSCEDILIKSGMSYRRRGNQRYLFCPNCDRDQFLIDRAEKGKSQNDRAFTGREIPDHCSVNIRKNKYFCFTCSAEKKNGRVISAGGGPA